MPGYGWGEAASDIEGEANDELKVDSLLVFVNDKGLDAGDMTVLVLPSVAVNPEDATELCLG